MFLLRDDYFENQPLSALFYLLPQDFRLSIGSL